MHTHTQKCFTSLYTYHHLDYNEKFLPLDTFTTQNNNILFKHVKKYLKNINTGDVMSESRGETTHSIEQKHWLRTIVISIC